jgi:hypothetical protein
MRAMDAIDPDSSPSNSSQPGNAEDLPWVRKPMTTPLPYEPDIQATVSGPSAVVIGFFPRIPPDPILLSVGYNGWAQSHSSSRKKGTLQNTAVIWAIWRVDPSPYCASYVTN